MELVDWMGVLIIIFLCVFGLFYLRSSNIENKINVEFGIDYQQAQQLGKTFCDNRGMTYIGVTKPTLYDTKVICKTTSPDKIYFFDL